MPVGHVTSVAEPRLPTLFWRAKNRGGLGRSVIRCPITSCAKKANDRQKEVFVHIVQNRGGWANMPSNPCQRLDLQKPEAQRHARITTGLKLSPLAGMKLEMLRGATPCPDHDGIETTRSCVPSAPPMEGATPCPDHDGIETNRQVFPRSEKSAGATPCPDHDGIETSAASTPGLSGKVRRNAMPGSRRD